MSLGNSTATILALIALSLPANAQRFQANETGGACITDVDGTVVTAGQANLYQYGVRIRNRCDRTIRVRVCRSGGYNCIVVSARPGGETSAVLGVGTSSSFTPEYSEL